MGVSAGDRADLLASEEPESGRRAPRAQVVAMCLIAVLAAAVVALLQREERDAAPVQAVGSMVFEDISSRTVERASSAEQHRDGSAIGSIELELPDRQLRGDARLEFGASVEVVDGEPRVLHAWGDVRLRFGADSCRGHFGWSSSSEPLEGGGSMHVRCEDGATIAARLAATDLPQSFELVIDLEDGWYDGGG